MLSSCLSSTSNKPRSLLRFLIAGVLAAFVAVAALPHYWSGQWPWADPPGVPNIRLMRTLQQQGLVVPGWQSTLQEIVTFGGDKWSVQQFTIEPPIDQISQVALLLKPQTSSQDQPEVEWLDVKGAQQWTIDSQRRLDLAPPVTEEHSNPFKAHFFRAWQQQQTYAVVQWYAWPQGGHPAVSHWFWADQKVQWQFHQRLPWIAVCLLAPLPPLEDITQYQPTIERLAQTVQSALQTEVFSE